MPIKQYFDEPGFVCLDLHVVVRRHGWTIPAVIRADPDDCSPAESEQEIEITGIEIAGIDLDEKDPLYPLLKTFIEEEADLT